MNRQGQIIFVILMLVAGLGLRLWMPGLIEFKLDEAYMWAASQGLARLESFPALGMPSGAGGLRNPGLSIWAFSFPAQFLGLESPEALSRFVGITHIVSLGILLSYALLRRTLSSFEREVWLWGIALTAVQPMLLIFTRKIWAQSLLPIFFGLVVILWIERKKSPLVRLPLVLIAMLVGQVHMSGFFLAAVILSLELRDVLLGRTPLWPLLGGALLGLVPLLPWLQEFVSGTQRVSTPHLEVLKFRYWTHVLSLGSGLYFSPVLGTQARDFLSQMWVATAMVLSALAFVLLMGRALILFFKNAWDRLGALVSLRRFDSFSPTGQLLWIGLWACGLLMTLSNTRIYRHYLILVTPLVAIGFVWLALKLFPKRAPLALGLYAVLQLFLSVQVLSFLNRHHGAPRGDFGTAYEYMTLDARQNLLDSVERNP